MMDLEKKLQSPRLFRSSVETEVDSQYLCQFTMLLMDTVEELTVKVSQIEFVCRQHFPDLQTLSQTIQKKILGFKKTEDLEWGKREDHLLKQIEELQSERTHAQEQITQLNASLQESWKKIANKEQSLNRCQLEKKELLEQLMQKVNENVKVKELEKDLLQQIKLKDQKIEEELSKKKSLFEECNKLKTNYKHLKSQYNFLISRLGNAKSDSRHSDMMSEDENGTASSCLKKRCNEDMKNDVQEVPLHASKLTKSKIDVAHRKEIAFGHITESKKDSDAGSCSNISIKQGLISSKLPLNVKKEAPSSPKPAASLWRDTRSRQELKDGDPHDDFFNTPLENVRNLNMNLLEVNVNPIVSDKDVDGDCSDEDVLDLNSETMPERCPISMVGPSNKGFKYVEPVRRKSERENLKGIECQQCKKFYDAVLPDGGKAANTMRCEHHDGVSRHRYRYAPPLTPEGFWNIGFDSDL
ncbi:protein gamma response 1 [Phalaenopsis equestris]|uniref:protein gamma response 1 n=1 Tax=Phalaenopsis equestris TaxID=78828 RepID=UPI0009E2BAA2|nr:protein gamma response 1 [Phalaenopsis equestris]